MIVLVCSKLDAAHFLKYMICHIPSIISANYSDASRFLKYMICHIPIIIAAICYMGWVDNQGNVIHMNEYTH